MKTHGNIKTANFENENRTFAELINTISNKMHQHWPTREKKTATEQKPIIYQWFCGQHVRTQQNKNGIIKCVDQIKSFFFSRFMKFEVQNAIKDLSSNKMNPKLWQKLESFKQP